MELGETVADAAARETLEEAEAQVEVGALIAIVDVLQARQVHIFFFSGNSARTKIRRRP